MDINGSAKIGMYKNTKKTYETGPRGIDFFRMTWISPNIRPPTKKNTKPTKQTQLTRREICEDKS